MSVIKDKGQFWEFKPRYMRGDIVWWVDERLKFGTISGLYFENTDKLAIMFLVLESTGGQNVKHDIMQERLFPDKDALLTYLKENL